MRYLSIHHRDCHTPATAIRLACIFCLLAAASYARAEQPIWATGHVVDSSGRPAVGALVAVYDDNNRVVDYARTDRNGDYAVAVPRHALHLDQHHGKGFFAEVFGTVTRFVGWAADFVANPIRAGLRAVTATEAASFADPLTRGEIAAGGAVVDQTLFAVSPKPRYRVPVPLDARKQPGALFIKVIAPDQNDLVGVSHIYWLQDEIMRAGGRDKRTTAAWLDPVQLTSVDSDRPSHVESDYLNITGRLQPSIAETGEVVRISAIMHLPPTPEVHVVVIARNARTGETWELEPVGDGRYEGEFVVDKRCPRNDQTISLFAYAASEQRPGRRKDTEEAIIHAGLCNTQKPYMYDPLLVVSRNRYDLTLTVVAPSKHRRGEGEKGRRGDIYN